MKPLSLTAQRSSKFPVPRGICIKIPPIIKNIIQDCRDKLKSFDDNFSQKYSYSQTCFVGDDIVDSNLLSKVGLGITVPNANYINHIAKPHWITPRKGGQGAVRDVCDLIYIAKKSVK